MANPVMFVVEAGSVLTTLQMIRGPHTAFEIQITLWLWFTVVFANFAEAMAEGRGKAQADNLRKAKTATKNDWGAICYCDGQFYQAKDREDLEIFDRVGGGDSFASGLIYGFLAGEGLQWAVECGAAHGALAMTTPGDTSMATLKEVVQIMKGVGARIAR